MKSLRPPCPAFRSQIPYLESLLLVGSLLALSLTNSSRAADNVTIAVQVDHPGASINPAMWGIFFEDINFGADGGLYAQLVKNGGFEFPDPMMGWTKVCPGADAKVEISEESPYKTANPHYARLHSDDAGTCGLLNDGFRGIGIRKGEPYDFSVRLRTPDQPARLVVQLENADGKVLASSQISGQGREWKKFSLTLRSAVTEPKARLRLTLASKGNVDIDEVSLFPKHTWKNRPSGLRADMVQMLADLKPGFLRFPGGCIVEGSELSRRYQWKNTIGPVDERHLLINRWNYEFKHRPAPDYFQSYGLGFYEFFQLCEDIGAQPLPILNCGMACQFNTGQLVPLAELDPYVQDMLDLVEFARGPVTSTWGARRAALGHPKPFVLKMLGVGNEQWGPQYIERYTRIAQELKKRYPDLLLVSSAGPSPADDRFQFLWPKLRELHADIVDEHCYAAPAWFFDNTHRYDNYDRSGPKVFMGEYAAQSVGVASPLNKNNWECALAEAAYMSGLERNADVVRMASYAPLFASADAWQWTPDLIWADNLNVYGTPNYYVQQLFSRNRGDVLLPIVYEAKPSKTPAGFHESSGTLYASAVRDDRAHEVILKIVNATGATQTASVNLQGAKSVRGSAKAIVLAGENADEVNSFSEPKRIAPRETKLSVSSPVFQYQAPPSSLTILRIPIS